MMHWPRTIALFCFACAPLFLWSQSDSLKAMSTELPQVDIREIHVDYVGMIPREVRAFHQMRSLDQMLEHLPEVTVRNYGATGIAMPSFRGTGAGHTQLYWYGLPVNSLTLGVSDLSLSPIDLFEDLSVQRGLQSLQNGPGGIGGNILLGGKGNWERWSDHELTFGTEMRSFGNSSSLLQWQGPLADGIQASTTAMYNAGQNDFPFRNPTLPGNPLQNQTHAFREQVAIAQDFVLGNVAKSSLAGHFFFQHNDRQLPPTLLSSNQFETQEDQQFRGMLRYQRELETLMRTWQLRASAAWLSEQVHYQNELAAIDSDTRVQSQVLDLEFSDQPSYADAHFYSGLRLSHSQVQSPGLAPGFNPWSGTAFVRREAKIRNWAHWEGLLRQSFQGNLWAAPTGYLKGKFRFSDHALHPDLYLSVGRNNRFPSLNDLYWSPGGNPNLSPESAWMAEAGGTFWKNTFHAPGSNRLKHHLFFEGGIYASYIRDYILWTPLTGSIWAAENVQRVFSKGGEMRLTFRREYPRGEWGGQIAYGLSISRNLDQLNAHDQSQGQQLIYTPLHNGSLLLKLRRDKWMLNWSQSVTGKRFTTRDGSESLPAFTLSRMRLERSISWEKKRKSRGTIHLYGGMDNIWNVAYQTIPQRPMPGRSYFGGLRLAWKQK